MKKIIFLMELLFIAACTQGKDFKYGLSKVIKLNSKYNSTMETYPSDINQINLMLSDLTELKSPGLDSGQEPFNYIVDYQRLNLEAEKLYIQSQKYGNAGTTEYGFGCKIRPLIIESAALRNMAAQKGFDAVNLLKDFVEKYPKEASSAGLSQKNALFLNATFYEVGRVARSDSNIINHFCPENVTLEIYRQQFRKETNFSKSYIDNLNYNDAVQLWKISWGIA